MAMAQSPSGRSRERGEESPEEENAVGLLDLIHLAPGGATQINQRTPIPIAYFLEQSPILSSPSLSWSSPLRREP